MGTIDIGIFMIMFLKCKGMCKTFFFLDKIKNDCHTIKGIQSFVTKKQRECSAKFATHPYSTCVKLRVGGWLRKSSSGMLLGIIARQASDETLSLR